MVKISAVHIAIAALAVLLLVPGLTAQSGEQAAGAGVTSPVVTSPTLTSPTVTTAGATSAGVTKVRIVRLSEVKGEAQLDPGVGRGFEPAIVNLPIVGNCRLKTGDGVAEVEFEDNSSLRLGPDSEVEFPTLERLADGATVSSVRVVKGMAYVSLMKTEGNEFNLLFGQRSLELPPASHVRLEMEGSQAELAVLGGDVEIKSPEGLLEVAHKKTITFALAGSGAPTVARSVERSPFDDWDHNSVEYQERRASMSALNSTPYTYGLNDMMYYGDFADMGGCGMMWRPYFASAAWDPYANGAWAWYGDMGYSWVSPYPWGWTPYHYGAWSFCPGTGWGWMPGGSWMGLNNGAGFAGLPGPIRPPRVPVHPPRLGKPTLQAVNQRPLIRSQVSSSRSSASFVFRRDSAGLGIPRDELGKLNEFSKRADARGTARTPVYMEAPAGVSGRAAFAGVPTMSRGYAPLGEAPRPEMGGERGTPDGRMSGPPMSSPRMSSEPMSGPSMSGPRMSGGAPGGQVSAPSGHGR